MDRAAYAQVALDVGGFSALIQACGHSVQHRAVIKVVAKPGNRSRSSQSKRPGAFRLRQCSQLESAGDFKRSGQNETAQDIFARWTVIPFSERLQRIANAIDVVKKLAQHAAPRAGAGKSVICNEIETARNV